MTFRARPVARRPGRSGWDAGARRTTPINGDVQAQLTKEATTTEQRHVEMIEVQPATDPNSGQVGEAQKAEAKAKADKALVDLKSGKSWDDVAKTVSTAASAPQAGDIGWVT